MARRSRAPSSQKAKSQKKQKGRNVGDNRKRRAFFFFLLISAVASAALLYFLMNGRDLSSFQQSISRAVEYAQDMGGRLYGASWKAELYFGDYKADYLIAENRWIRSPSEPEKKSAALIKELIKGPSKRGFRTIPAQTLLRSVHIDRGIARVSFSDGLSRFHPGGSTSEMLTVFSIVNSLAANVPEVKRVRILINDRPIDTIAGHIDCRESFSPDMRLVH